MVNLIDKLKMFNAKERFFLVGHILGNASFQPSNEFLKELSEKLAIDIPDAEHVFTAMDYHLDWLHAALQVFTSGNEQKCYSNEPDYIKGKQEDVDFILAWQEEEKFHVVLIEAKGVTSWTNSQIRSKAKRMREIWGNDGKLIEKVVPHFVLMSPRESKGLEKDICPDWMCPKGNFTWMRLKLPENYGTHKVCRCNSNNKIGKGGGYWGVFKR